jgi:hypothetical protein
VLIPSVVGDASNQFIYHPNSFPIGKVRRAVAYDHISRRHFAFNLRDLIAMM